MNHMIFQLVRYAYTTLLGLALLTPSAMAQGLSQDFGRTGSLKAGTPLGNGPGWIFMAPNGHRRDLVGWVGGVYLGASYSKGPPSAQIVLLENGNVGIGTTQARNILTIVRGSATDPVADDWTRYSSKEYKRDISTLTPEDERSALRALLTTPVVRFRYKDQGPDAKEKIGVIAEDAPKELLAEANSKALSLSDYISFVHAAMKAQQLIIEKHQQLLYAQQKQIDHLEAQLERLIERESRQSFRENSSSVNPGVARCKF